MGGGGKGKQRFEVPEYYLTVDYGVCHGPIDSLDEIWVKDKLVWAGYVTQNMTLTLNDPNAFGGHKKEGGVVGRVDCYMGTDDQVMTGPSAARYGRLPTTMPGYRGIAHFLFRGFEAKEASPTTSSNGLLGKLVNAINGVTAATSSQWGFLWCSNNPFFPAAWITGTRNPKGWEEDLAAIPRNGIGDRSVFFLLDRSNSLSGAEFNNIKNSCLAGLNFMDLSISLGNRVDVAVRFWSQGAADVMIQKPNATLADIDEVRDFIAATGQLTGGNVVPGYEAARDWFLATAGDSLVARSLILVTDAASNDGFSTAASGPAADMLNNSTGTFSRANGNPVDMYAVNYNQPTIAYTELLDNTPFDGVPTISSSDTSGLNNAIRNAILSGRKLDSNPAHIIRECLTNEEWGRGIYEAEIDDVSFLDAAQILFNEGFGLAFVWRQQASVEKIIQEVCDHIQAMVFINPYTGLWTLRLIRGGYDLDTLVRLNPSNCKATNRQRKAMSETINEIVVTYTDSDTHEDTVVNFQDDANIAMQDGAVRSDSRNYYAIRTRRLAALVGARDLRSGSQAMFSCDLSIDSTAGRVLPGDVVLLSWPDDGIVDMPCRIGPVNFGKPGASAVTTSGTEDVFGSEYTEYEPGPDSLWEDPDADPEPAEYIDVITPPLPLLLRSGLSLSDVDDSDFPVVQVAVLVGSINAKVQSALLSAEVVKATGEVVVEQVSEVPDTPVRLTTAVLNREAQSTIAGETLRLLVGVGGEPATGDFLQIGQGDTTSEIGLILSYDEGLDLYTVARGMFDTTPKLWPIGSVLWYLGPNLNTIESSENATDVPSFYLVQTTNSGGVLALTMATNESFTPSARPYAPHRPANAKVNGVAFTEVVFSDRGASVVPAAITITWSNRNRFDEDVVPPHWDDATVTPEVGQTTTIRVCNRFDGAVLFTYSGIAEGVTTFDISPTDFMDADREIDVKLYAVRAGIESVQPAVLPIQVIRVGYGRDYGYNYGGPDV